MTEPDGEYTGPIYADDEEPDPNDVSAFAKEEEVDDVPLSSEPGPIPE